MKLLWSRTSPCSLLLLWVLCGCDPQIGPESGTVSETQAEESGASGEVVGFSVEKVSTSPTNSKALDGLDEPTETPPDQCVDGPNKATSKTEKVYYGTEHPSYLPMTPEQTWAVGWFYGCSGLLIKPDWVLSASHCSFLWGGSFCIGKNPSNPNHCIAIEQAYDHPWADLAVVKLSQDARLVLPGVEPIPLLTEDLGPSWVGRTAEAAGYGTQEHGGTGEREFTAEPIVWMSDSTVSIDGEGKHGVCFGDSGGPLMVIASDGSVRSAGALSNGDSSCVGVDNYTRVDVFRDWIEGYTGPTTLSGPQPCEGITNLGECSADNAQARYCGADETLTVDVCSDDHTCSWSSLEGGWRCVAPPEDACEGLTSWGACDGNTLRWCHVGGLQERDCGACGESCVPNSTWGYYCVPSDCGDVDYQGVCEGAVAKWCDNQGQLATRDCAEYGQGCGFFDDETGFYCVDHTCGDLDYLGRCNGNIAEWCDGKKIKTKDCTASGEKCAWAGDEKGYYCVEDSSPCGDVDYFGKCEGTVALWCNKKGHLKSVDCATTNQACGIVTDDMGFHCLPQACGELDFLGQCEGDTVTWCNRDGVPESLDCGNFNQNCGLLSDTSGMYCIE